VANNVQAEAVSTAGTRFVTAEVTAYGDATSHIPASFQVIVSGSEGSQTFAEIVGGAGAVAAGVQRVTLASDDPAVTALQILDNAISGTEMQVDVVAALPAGTNAIGKLAANSGVDIGDVDVTSVVPGTGATNLGKAIDTALGATDTGVLALTVRDDSLATLTEIDGDVSALRVDSTGRLWCNVSNTLTVASHAVTNAGTFAVQATCTNAGTFAVQATCTNAGTFAVQVDGNALTALQLIDDCIYADDGAWTGDSSKHALVGGIYQSSPQTITDGRTAPIQLTANGYQIVSVNGTVTVGSHAVTNAGTFAVQATCTNAGTFAVQVDGNALTALQLIDDVVFADDAAFTLGTSKGVMMMGFAGTQSVDANDACALACTTAGYQYVAAASGAIASGAIASGAVASGAFASGALAAGSIAAGAIADMIVDDAAFTPATSRVLMAGFEADESATDSVDEGDGGAARMTLDRKQIVTDQPHTAGGLSIFRTLDLDETEEDVKTAAGQVYSIYAFNTTNAILWLKFYNATAANVTVGTTTPVLTLGVPGNNDTDGAGFVWNVDKGLAFDTAICVAATTGVADNDTGAPGANALIVNLGYK
jgi:hypothetical protein